MMVTAHQGDLLAARQVGLRTAFVPRPLEFGPGHVPDMTPDPSFDRVVGDLDELANEMIVQKTVGIAYTRPHQMLNAVVRR